MNNNLKPNNAMKKRILSILAIFVFLTTPMSAQVFLTDAEEEALNFRIEPEVLGGLPFYPMQDVTYDQYAPLGGGWLLLGCLGGACLFKRRKKEND